MLDLLALRSFFWQLLSSIGYEADKDSYCDYLEKCLFETLKIYATNQLEEKGKEYFQQQIELASDLISLQKLLKLFLSEKALLEIVFLASKKVLEEILEELKPFLTPQKKQQLRSYLFLTMEKTGTQLPKIFRTRREA